MSVGLVSGQVPFQQAELVLYDLLRKEGVNAYGRYNSLSRALARWQRRNPVVLDLCVHSCMHEL